ncbi:MAG TPA: LysR family transcriptional regulator [Lysobacter sp.]
MNNVDRRQLQIFLTLMSELSVTRAASRLGVGQSAVSQSLTRLRELFSDPLLLRSRGGMVPTDRARDLEQSVRKLLADYDRLVAPPETFDPAISRRRFVVSVPEYAEYVLMPHLLSRFRVAGGGLRLEARAPQPDRAAEMLESGELDLRIAWLLNPPASMRSMPLFQDEIVCLASRSHSLVQGRLNLDQFLGLPHVYTLGTGRSTTSQVLEAAAEREGRGFDRPFLVQNFLTIPHIVGRTDMLATMARRLAESFVVQHNLQLLPVPLKLPKIRYAAYWHERGQRDVGHRWLREQLAGAARAI